MPSWLLRISVILFGAGLLVSCNSNPDQRSSDSLLIRIDGSSGVRPLVETLADAYVEADTAVRFQFGKGLDPQARIDALRSGAIDLAMASHGLDAEALEKEGFRVLRFAEVPIVFAVNKAVGLQRLQSVEVCRIYNGEYSNWSELGGPDLPIAVFARPATEVDAEVILQEIPCFEQVRYSDGVKLQESSGDMARAIAINEGGIGMTTSVRVARSAGQLSALELPSAVTGNLHRDCYLIAGKDISATLDRFLRFVDSGAGATLLRANNASPTNEE